MALYTEPNFPQLIHLKYLRVTSRKSYNIVKNCQQLAKLGQDFAVVSGEVSFDLLKHFSLMTPEGSWLLSQFNMF